MKKLIVILALTTTTLFAADGIIKRGAPVAPQKQAVPLEQLLANPDAYGKSPVVVEGVVSNACSAAGCWMQIAPAAGAKGVRVTFKDYGFVVPKDSKGMKARAEGVMKVKTLTKDEADHLTGDGADLTRNADGTAREISFVANGVELHK
jgi:hypothetical protein